MRRRVFHFALLLLASIGLGILPQVAAAQSDAVVVYLVRHAERAEDGTNDPPISEAGEARAQLLATLLADAGATRLHTTDYKRTRATGAPLAQALGLDMDTYDPRDLAGFAAALRAAPGRHVVFGHSNTTPALVTALGGDAGAPIDESEYDRLYTVVISPDGTVTTVLLRFGAPYQPSHQP